MLWVGTKIRKKGDLVPFGETDATRVVTEHRTIHRKDLRQEKTLAQLDKEFFEEGFLSDIRIPLKVYGKVAALLNIGSRRADRFNEEDVITAETIADQLSIALENSMLFKEIEKSSKVVTSILESITDSFFALDSKWRFVYVNPAAGIQLQKNHELLIGKNIWEEFSEAVGSTFYNEYHRAIAENVTVTFEEFYPPLNKWFEAHAYPANGGLSVYFRDITNRKRIDEERRQSLEMLREAQDGTIQALEAMVERRNPYTAGHERRVADLAVAIAEEIEFTSMQVEGVKMAGVIHDIGKIPYPLRF